MGMLYVLILDLALLAVLRSKQICSVHEVMRHPHKQVTCRCFMHIAASWHQAKCAAAWMAGTGGSLGKPL